MVYFWLYFHFLPLDSSFSKIVFFTHPKLPIAYPHGSSPDVIYINNIYLQALYNVQTISVQENGEDNKIYAKKLIIFIYSKLFRFFKKKQGQKLFIR